MTQYAGKQVSKKEINGRQSKNSCNFWREVLCVNRAGNRRAPTAPVVDGIHSNADIAKHFADKLHCLSICVSSYGSILEHCTCDLLDEDPQNTLVSVECDHQAFTFLN